MSDAAAKPGRKLQSHDWDELKQGWIESSEPTLSAYARSKNVSASLLRKWAARGNWLDVRAEVKQKVQELAIEKHVQTQAEKMAAMLNSHYEDGGLIRDLARRFLKKRGIRSETAALSALTTGVEMQRRAMGQASGPGVEINLSQTSQTVNVNGADDLRAEILRRLSRVAGEGQAG